MVMDPTKFPTFEQDFNGYAIDGDMPYANSDDIVLCITGDGKIINALFSIFRAAHSTLPYEFERRQLYLAAESDSYSKAGVHCKVSRCRPQRCDAILPQVGHQPPMVKDCMGATKWSIRD